VEDVNLDVFCCVGDCFRVGFVVVVDVYFGVEYGEVVVGCVDVYEDDVDLDLC
jgi:hypothetical protein